MPAPPDLPAALRRARAAQERWAAVPLRTRARRLRDVRRVLVRHVDDIVATIRASAGIVRSTRIGFPNPAPEPHELTALEPPSGRRSRLLIPASWS